MKSSSASDAIQIAARNATTVITTFQTMCIRAPWMGCQYQSRFVSAPEQTLEGRADVRFGSLADISQCNRHVRFTPKSGHQAHFGPHVRARKCSAKFIV